MHKAMYNLGDVCLDAPVTVSGNRLRPLPKQTVDQNSCMKKILKYIPVILLGCCAASCAPIELHPDNEPVRLIFYNEVNLTKNQPACTYISPIVSSYGHWYNYLWISNEDMTYGAIDDLYNKANEIGANLIYINKNIDFTTSVTLWGQAYHCNN